MQAIVWSKFACRNLRWKKESCSIDLKTGQILLKITPWIKILSPLITVRGKNLVPIVQRDRSKQSSNDVPLICYKLPHIGRDPAQRSPRKEKERCSLILFPMIWCFGKLVVNGDFLPSLPSLVEKNGYLFEKVSTRYEALIMRNNL